MGFGGSQDKDNMWWRFLQCLEQGIGGFFGEHVDFIYNIDFIAGFVGGIVDPLAELSNFIDAPIAGSINLYDIQGSPLGYCLAYRTGITRLTLAIGKTVNRLS